MSAEENVWRWSGGDWRIGHAHESGGSARDKTVSGASHLTFTLGAMSTAVKQYNVGLDKSTSPGQAGPSVLAQRAP
jgi:hypothetical protein